MYDHVFSCFIFFYPLFLFKSHKLKGIRENGLLYIIFKAFYLLIHVNVYRIHAYYSTGRVCWSGFKNICFYMLRDYQCSIFPHFRSQKVYQNIISANLSLNPFNKKASQCCLQTKDYAEAHGEGFSHITACIRWHYFELILHAELTKFLVYFQPQNGKMLYLNQFLDKIVIIKYGLPFGTIFSYAGQ